MDYGCRLKLRGVIKDTTVGGLLTRMSVLIINKDRKDISLKGFPSSHLSSGSLHLNCCHHEILAVSKKLACAFVVMIKLR